MTSDAPTTLTERDADHALPPGWMHVHVGSSSVGGAPGDLARHGRVRALMSARAGGFSAPPYEACNLGDHVKDAPEAVARNRAAFAQAMGATPMWLSQVHGNRLVRLSRSPGQMAGIAGLNPETAMAQPEADGAITTEPGLACTVMVADCLPVLLAAPEGRGVAALHAGWRGLAGAGGMRGQGILHTGVHALCEATGADPADLSAWLGPCIGPDHFEVGPDVLIGFGMDPAHVAGHPRFKPQAPCAVPDRAAAQALANAQAVAAGGGKWLADLAGLAQDTLQSLGVQDINGGNWCTVSDRSMFFSFRRDGVTGRQAAGICIL